MSKHVEFGVNEFNQFIENELKPAVYEFNGACGKDPHNVEDQHEAAEMIINECKRVIEECDETVKAFHDKDVKERLDGVVDVYWTTSQLYNVVGVLREKFPDIIHFMKENYDFDEVLLLQYAMAYSLLAITVGQGTIISGHRIALAAKRIIINNKLKYTDNLELAKTWAEKMPEGCIMESNMYNGKEFHCIKRVSDDYIVKPFDFKPVNLEDIV